MRRILVIISFVFFSNIAFAEEEITPYKFSDAEYNNGFSEYIIPKSSIFTVARSQKNAPDITYYYSKPKHSKEFPIAIFCTGSSSEGSVSSVIHVHRYFLKEFLDLGAALITVEQWGVNNNQPNVDEFMHHYTRTQRLIDHKVVIEYLLKNPPQGWDGKLIFVGVSEGGPLVTALAIDYPNITLATINWCGAGDWNWREELWFFIEDMRVKMLSSIPMHIRIRSYLPSWMPYSVDLHLPKTRSEYDEVMNQTLADPTPEKQLMGMTYMYHADSLNWPKINYEDIKSPYLVVAGGKDSLVKSIDELVDKSRQAGVKITYLRVPDMDHYVRKRQDVLEKSFDWLKKLVHP